MVFGKDVGDGGIVRSNQKEHIEEPAKLVGFSFGAAAAGTARGGKGVPAESGSMGTGWRIEGAKGGGRDGLIGGD